MCFKISESLEKWFTTIKNDAEEALEALNNFAFNRVRGKLESVIHICKKINPDGCGWCGQPHKTKDCPLRDAKGFFYHRVEYRISNDRNDRILKQAQNILAEKIQSAKCLSTISQQQEIKQKLQENATRLEIAHKELDSAIEEFNSLFQEYQNKK